MILVCDSRYYIIALHGYFIILLFCCPIAAWSNCWPANNYGDYDRVAMRPENSGHVRNLSVLSGDNMAVRKFAEM